MLTAVTFEYVGKLIVDGPRLTVLKVIENEDIAIWLSLVTIVNYVTS